MESILALVVAVVVVVAAILIYRRASQSAMFKRAGRIIEAQVESVGTPDQAPGGGLANLRPGDAVSFWDGEDYVVETIVDCEERLNERVAAWRWVFFSGGKVMEIAPDGKALFKSSEVIYQGSAGFQKLTAAPEDEGVLKTFEERVRGGDIASSPVSFRHGRAVYRVRSTGAFRATVKGKALEQEVWRDIGPKPEDNVYFEMETSSGGRILGIWTTHIALLFGEALKDSDITDVFAKQS